LGWIVRRAKARHCPELNAANNIGIATIVGQRDHSHVTKFLDAAGTAAAMRLKRHLWTDETAHKPNPLLCVELKGIITIPERTNNSRPIAVPLQAQLAFHRVCQVVYPSYLALFPSNHVPSTLKYREHSGVVQLMGQRRACSLNSDEGELPVIGKKLRSCFAPRQLNFIPGFIPESEDFIAGRIRSLLLIIHKPRREARQAWVLVTAELFHQDTALDLDATVRLSDKVSGIVLPVTSVGRQLTLVADRTDPTRLVVLQLPSGAASFRHLTATEEQVNVIYMS
jgi:hypothetical protein